MSSGPRPELSSPARPVVVTDTAWYRLADDMAVALASSSRSLIWLTADRGAGKTSWLQGLLPSLRTDYFLLDLRHELEAGRVQEQLGGHSEYVHGPAPALILDNLSPSELLGLLAVPDHPARKLVPGHSGPILLLSPEFEEDRVAVRRLERVTGRSLMRHELPPSSHSQNQAILVAHRKVTEQRWGVVITDEAMTLAASGLHYRTTPGQAVEWLGRTAARVAVVADEGPRECRRLRAEIETLNTRISRNQELGEPVDELEPVREALSLELAATEIDWLERQAQGTLMQVLPEDLREELESLTGSGDHPDLVIKSDATGGSLSAGSGNLRS